MPIFGLVIVIIIALGIIVKSADIFVEGASSVALKLKVAPFIIGLTIVAMGTSSPELFINLIAANEGQVSLLVGNIFGSNIVGILLGLGITAAFVAPLTIKSQTVWKEIPLSLLGAFLILVFGSDMLLDGATANILSRVEGVALLGFFVIFVVYTFGLKRNKSNEEEKLEEEESENEKMKEYSWAKSILYVIGGLFFLVISGDLIVHSGSIIAEEMGVTQNLIGLTLVAIGTSFPEIVTTIMAARKGNNDIAVGTIVGTTIFNIFFALGVTALVTSLPFNTQNLVDASFLLLVTIIFFVFMFVGKKHILERWQGVALVLFYIAYLVFIIMREVY